MLSLYYNILETTLSSFHKKAQFTPNVKIKISKEKPLYIKV